MKLAFVQPRKVIDLVAGMIGLLFDRFDGEMPIHGETSVDSQQAADSQPVTEAQTTTDDLTKINGIGPAFARRLAQAGVSTYAQLASMTANEVRQRAKLAEWQADPEDWISQAAALTTN